MQVLNNTPSVGYIQWSDLHITYKGTTYTIPNGSSNLTYIYWKYSDPSNLYASGTFPTMGDDDLLVFLNKNGTHTTVPTTTIIDGSLIVPESIIANALAANSVTGQKILAGEIDATHIKTGSITGTLIKANTLTADLFASVSPNLAMPGWDNIDQLDIQQLTSATGAYSALTKCELSTNACLVGKYSLWTQNSAANSYKYLGNTNKIAAAAPGERFIASVYACTAQTGVQVSINIVPKDAAGNTLAGNTGTYTISQGAWYRLSAAATMPANTAQVTVYVRTVTATACDVYYDAFQLEKCEVVTQTDPTDWKPSGATVINGGNITARTITASQLNVTQLSAITSDLGSVRAGDINIGNGNFVVDASGNATIKGNATFQGTINTAQNAIIGNNINIGNSTDLNSTKQIIFNTGATLTGEKVTISGLTSTALRMNSGEISLAITSGSSIAIAGDTGMIDISASGTADAFTQLYGTNGVVVSGTSGGNGLKLEGYDHTYLQFFPTGVLDPRAGWIGYGSVGTTLLSVKNEIGDISLTPLAQVNVGGTLNLANNTITNVNHIKIADPGNGEGIEWVGGSGWIIHETDDAGTGQSPGAYPLQFFTGSTRRATFGTTGNFYVTGTMMKIQNNSGLFKSDGSYTGLYNDPSGCSLYVGTDGAARVYSQAVYDRTYASGATMTVTSAGTIGRISSARKYKLDIQDVDAAQPDKILALNPRTWYDKVASERYAEYLTMISTVDQEGNQKTPEDVDLKHFEVPYLERASGLIAEEVEAAGLGEFVVYGEPDASGIRQPESLMYDRLWVLLIPIVKDLRDRVASLEKQLAASSGQTTV